jgi:hypothetical protein
MVFLSTNTISQQCLSKYNNAPHEFKCHHYYYACGLMYHSKMNNNKHEDRQSNRIVDRFGSL